jgi:hypothetical protein
MNECVNLGTFETGEGRFELKGGFQESSKSGFGSGVRMRGVRREDRCKVVGEE